MDSKSVLVWSPVSLLTSIPLVVFYSVYLQCYLCYECGFVGFYGMTKSQIYFESEKKILHWKLVTETLNLSLQEILNG